MCVLGVEGGGVLLFVTLNDHLTLALKSFTGQVGEKGRGAGGSRREAHSLQEGQRRGKREQPEQRMDGWTDRARVCMCACLCVCVGEFLRAREGESEGCVPQG